MQNNKEIEKEILDKLKKNNNQEEVKKSEKPKKIIKKVNKKKVNKKKITKRKSPKKYKENAFLKKENIKKRKIAKNKKRLRRYNYRYIIVLLPFLLGFLMVIAQVTRLQLTHHSHGVNLEDFAIAQTTQKQKISAQRGVIYDDHGQPLAVNISEYHVTATLDPENLKYDEESQSFVPYFVSDPDKTTTQMVEILGYKGDQEAEALISGQLHKDPKKIKQVEFGKYGAAISLEQKKKLEKAGIEGLSFKENPERYYPYGEFASYLLGYTSNDEKASDENKQIKGEMGVEKELNAYLTGKDGVENVQVDNAGVVSTNSEEILASKTDGTSVYLTIDSVIQTVIHDSMKSALEGKNYDRASTVLIDANNGAILGAESFPTFNPNFKDIKDYQDPFYNTCFEPGSTIKTFLVASAMEEGLWEPDTKIKSGTRSDSKWGEDNYIADWLYNQEKTSWGSITWEEGYYFSSNVAMISILDAVGYDTWIKYATDVFDLGVPIEGIIDSSTCDFSPNYPFEIATTTFGQGMTANIMQILRGYTIFGNDGKMINPYLIQSINDSETGEEIYNGLKEEHPQDWKEGEDGVEINKQGQYEKKVISKESAAETLKLMEGVMYYNEGGNFAGTGRSYGKAIKHRVAGKTGTSQVAVKGSFDNNSSLYSAVVMAPADDPQIIMYTSVANPSSPYPNQYIKNYMATIIDNTLDYLNYGSKENTEDKKEELKLLTTPDFKNKKNNELSETAGAVKYKQFGTGKIINQYPQSGSQITEETKVLLLGADFKIEDLVGENPLEAVSVCLLKDNICTVKGSKNKVISIQKTKNEYILNTKSKK